MKKLLIFAGLSALGATAFGQELVVNGGFETGDMTGWTVVNLGSFSGVDSGGGTPHSGIHYFGMGATTLANQTDFYQDIVTIPTVTYIVSFWAYDQSPGNGIIHVTFGGTEIGPASGNVGANYTQYTQSVLATTASTRLEVTGWEPPQWVISDDYSVQAVPEPASLLAIGAGLAALAARRRRK